MYIFQSPMQKVSVDAHDRELWQRTLS